MDSFTLEVTVNRIGGSDLAERVFGPWSARMIPSGGSTVTLAGRYRPSDSVTLRFGTWHLVRPGLLSTDLQISNTQGAPIGPPRPVLYAMHPSDIPLYSTHIGNDPDQGVFSVGLRSPAYRWTADAVRELEDVPAA